MPFDFQVRALHDEPVDLWIVPHSIQQPHVVIVAVPRHCDCSAEDGEALPPGGFDRDGTIFRKRALVRHQEDILPPVRGILATVYLEEVDAADWPVRNLNAPQGA